MSALYKIVEVATFAAFIILFLGKTGLREKIRDYFDSIDVKIVADMLDCDFCLSFWTCFVLATIAVVLTSDVSWYVAIVCAPPLTRRIL